TALPAKPSSYRQWVKAVQNYDASAQKAYWQHVLAEQKLAEPMAVTHHKVELDSHLTDVLLRQANNVYSTQINDLLLSALAIALGDVRHITLEGHGREAIDATMDTTRTVGWFTTLYPVKLTCHEQLIDTIVHTKEMLRAIPDKGIGFDDLNNLPPISFNYLGQLAESVENDLGLMIDARNTDKLLLNINGAVQDGRLQFGVISRIGELFAKDFEAALISVIEHCARALSIKTPSDYGVKGLSIAHLRLLQNRYDIEALYPAGSLQQGFIYHHLNFPHDDAYRVQLLLDYPLALNVDAYKMAWTLASKVYPALRSAFDWRDDILQVITKGTSISDEHFSVNNISDIDEYNRPEAIAQIQRVDRALPFDLNQPGLLRFTLIEQHDELFTVLINIHHSISDGWSLPILLKTVHDNYNNLCNGRSPKLEIDKAYLATQAWNVEHQDEIEAHWSQAKKNLGGANDIRVMLNRSIDLKDTHTIEPPGEQLLTLQGSDYKALKTLCQAQGVTLNVALQFAWHKLLHSYTQDEQTIVGTTVSGRDMPVDGIESSVGLYINTLPLAVQWGDNTTVAEQLHAIAQGIATLNSHSSVSLASLQTNGERLFHSLFVFENYPQPVNDEQNQGIESKVLYRQSIEKVDYPLLVSAFELGESLVIKLGYGKVWLDETQANRLLNQMLRILHAVIEAPNQPHSEISLLSESKRDAVLTRWQGADVTYPALTLPQLFESQVIKTPEHIALVLGDVSLTYDELNQRANQLSGVIGKVKPDTLIALYLDRSLEMVISILAVLKAGGAYVPIAVDNPVARTGFILSDTQVPFVITQQKYQSVMKTCVEQSNGVCVVIAADGLPVLSVSDDKRIDNPDSIAGLDDLAYVIYTSGTTGKPKGVMVPHSAVVNRIQWMQSAYPINSADKVLQKTPYTYYIVIQLYNGT
ncbi:MAG: AMP-binding protein, partial [Algicola sp.]|nr:AMP-binding protein [Algicola sp.]